MSVVLILASSSPRRHALLREAGFAFEVSPPDVDESPLPREAPDALARRLARAKAEAVAAVSDAGACVLAADTVVVLGEDVLGKPRDVDEAETMLLRLANRTHRVLTGFAVLRRKGNLAELHVEESHVQMRAIEPAQARAYAQGGEPLDKAGAYAVQGEGGRFIRAIQGSRSNVIGLPMDAVIPCLERFGVRPKKTP